MQRYVLQLSYKGTHYFGWQRQNGQISVQEKIESVLSQLHSNQPIEITGCGRTDTGVHASCYFAHFDSDLLFETEQLCFKMNLMLPDDIAIRNIQAVSSDFNARFSAISRTYEYAIHQQKNPFLTEFSWYHRADLDIDKINQACIIMIGHKDFQCFSKVNTDVSNFLCNITKAEWIITEHGYLFTISANRFLRNMVRAITGTMIDVGLGKINLKEFETILQSADRGKAGTSVPAQGLNLINVEYPVDLISVL
ncbi:MAG: tRNA pseudouridine(38-40) synthase TruA [Crocinitomicaceae bacterium]|nr:tRNA pseudouridine(38-40) synthase TruA [Crocinitomicaceae bacterium]